jgi:hypothetical protein
LEARREAINCKREHEEEEITNFNVYKGRGERAGSVIGIIIYEEAVAVVVVVV